MEILDEVDENNKFTGRKLDKDYMHNNKIFHREVCAVIVNEKNECLIQKRASCKKQKPNMWGLTAGHVDAGEEEQNALVREIKEEIGIEVSKNRFEFIDIEKVNEDKNACYCYYYYIKIKEKIEEMTMQENEVSDLKYITIDELEHIINTKAEGYTFIEYSMMRTVISYLRNKTIK